MKLGAAGFLIANAIKIFTDDNLSRDMVSYYRRYYLTLVARDYWWLPKMVGKFIDRCNFPTIYPENK